jgi:FtsP/CotA-like multicopper oxidase with cupredoxin domain
MGLAGMISVNMPIDSKIYFWNLKEHQTQFSAALTQKIKVDWGKYYPDYFTINGLSFPDLQNDVSAKPTGKVGERILIAITNTGQSKHSIHFHGYHSKVIATTSNLMMVNDSKDTFPLESMSGLLLEMIPDKPGKYSVHDHNLVAISGGSMHPNGMFLMMEIEP